jgi:glucan phosphorylase
MSRCGRGASGSLFLVSRTPQRTDFVMAAIDLPLVAYFSMEIGLDPGMPTYAGGLGVLAGDTLRSAADLDIPMVAVTLLCRRGCLA